MQRVDGKALECATVGTDMWLMRENEGELKSRSASASYGVWFLPCSHHQVNITKGSTVWPLLIWMIYL